MDSVVRAAAVFLFLMIVFRLAGRRTLTEMSNFDFVLVLIISEATQNAMIGDDNSLTNAALVILTLITLDIGLSLLRERSPRLSRWLEGVPTVIVVDGKPLMPLMDWARVGVDDVLAAARESQGLERMDQIKYAILERHGKISIIPKSEN